MVSAQPAIEFKCTDSLKWLSETKHIFIKISKASVNLYSDS